jgi:diguanylate cyclase (GGDEF)-like protein
MGLNASNLGWVDPKTNRPTDELPWTRMMSQAETISGVPINITTKSRGVLSFMAKVSPILDDKGKSRGALVTFNDVTVLEKKNTELMETVNLLQQSRSKIELQNQELEILATHDSLTNCLNRRDFFAKAKKYFASVIKEDGKLACIMADIDHFKSVNDKYGHAYGDKVIQYVAGSLQSGVRANEEVCRYGGEEFCILLPGSSIEDAVAIAERIRIKISKESTQEILDAPGIRVTVSFGVSDIHLGATDIDELIAQADRALYRAKNRGRDHVVSWDMDKEKEFLANTRKNKQTVPAHVRGSKRVDQS